MSDNVPLRFYRRRPAAVLALTGFFVKSNGFICVDIMPWGVNIDYYVLGWTPAEEAFEERFNKYERLELDADLQDLYEKAFPGEKDRYYYREVADCSSCYSDEPQIGEGYENSSKGCAPKKDMPMKNFCLKNDQDYLSECYIGEGEDDGEIVNIVDAMTRDEGIDSEDAWDDEEYVERQTKEKEEKAEQERKEREEAEAEAKRIADEEKRIAEEKRKADELEAQRIAEEAKEVNKQKLEIAQLKGHLNGARAEIDRQSADIEVLKRENAELKNLANANNQILKGDSKVVQLQKKKALYEQELKELEQVKQLEQEIANIQRKIGDYRKNERRLEEQHTNAATLIADDMETIADAIDTTLVVEQQE